MHKSLNKISPYNDQYKASLGDIINIRV